MPQVSSDIHAFMTGADDSARKAALEAAIGATIPAAMGGDDNYVTDAEKIKLGNLSGTNTGDETFASICSKIGIATYANLAAANAALSVGQIYFDTALGTLNTATA